MSLLNNLKDRCTIRRRVQAKDSFGGSKDSFTNEQTDVWCWEQSVSAAEVLEYEKQAIKVVSKVYFASDPNVSSRHQIVVTERNGVALTTPVAYDVVDAIAPDASVGFGLLWRVMLTFNRGKYD